MTTNQTNKNETITQITYIICVLLVIVFGFLSFRSYMNLQHTKQKYEAKIEKIKQIEKNNKNIILKEKRQDEQMKIESVSQKSSKCLNLLFKFNGKDEYIDNMKKIKKEFPQVAKNSHIDSNGYNVGHSTSFNPSSSFEYKNILVGSQDESVGYLIQQTISKNDDIKTTSIKNWYVSFKLENGQLVLTSYYPLVQSSNDLNK